MFSRLPLSRSNPLLRRVSFGFPLALLLALSLPSALQASPLVWRWSNPQPHGNNIIGMAARQGLVIQVTDRGQIYSSTDLNSWIPRASPTRNSLRAVTFFGNRIVISGARGTILWADSLDQFHLVDLQSSDWLEGLAASTNLVVAVGDNAAIYTSADGALWQRHPQSFTNWLRGVAYGNGRFVAAGENGFIASSLNGVNWETHASGTTADLNQVGWLADHFLAVGDAGTAVESPDGLSWKTVTLGATNSLYTSALGTNATLVAGDGEVRLEQNTSWTDEIHATNSAFPAPDWTYLSSVWDDSLFLLGGRTGMIVEGFQTNAASAYVWIDRNESLRNWLWDITRTPDFYITVGDRATVMTSQDGINWELEPVPDSLTNSIFLGVGGRTNLFVVAGNQGSLMTSTNGLIWNAASSPSSDDLQGITTFGGLLVVSGGNGTILTSNDGVTWSARPPVTSAFLSSLAASPDRLVAVGTAGTILVSPDANSWTVRPSGTTNWIYRVRYLDGQFVAVGQGGTIFTSPDGLDWTPRTSPTADWLDDIAFIDQTFYAAGTHGAFLSSTNAIDWTSEGIITGKSLFGLATSQGQLIAVGVEGVILRSQVIPDPTPIQIQKYSHTDGVDLFLFSGNPDQRFNLDHSSDLTHWETGPLLEFLNGETTLIRAQNSPTNATQYFRPTLESGTSP